MISIEISFRDSTNVSFVILCFIKYAVRKTMWPSGKNMNFVSGMNPDLFTYLL